MPSRFARRYAFRSYLPCHTVEARRSRARPSAERSWFAAASDPL
jgi:hypothetical protein